MKVLVIDDKPEITFVISEFLNSKGIASDITNDPIEGLRKTREERYDAILLDILMPEFNGIDFIHTLERERKLVEQKIVVFSGLSLQDMEIDYLLKKKGVHGFIKKPINFSKLLNSIA